MNSLEQFKGKFILIDFWATWCRPCVKSIPTLNSLKKQYSENKFEIVSISVDKKIKTIEEFQKEYEMPWINWHADKNSELIKKWAVRAFPSYILIDREGKIIARSNHLGAQLRDTIKSAICSSSPITC